MGNRSTQKIPHVHFENLDALRFLAAFSVIIFHAFADLKSIIPAVNTHSIVGPISKVADKGTLGVSFFFVLSGFLITYLILHERKYKGYFSFKKFFIRRTLRIWPLYFIIILLGFVVLPLVLKDYQNTSDPLLYATFLANMDEIYNGGAYNFMTILWSVSVEEQFYLFWGVSLFFFLTIKGFKLSYLLIFLYFFSVIFCWRNLENETVIYYHTFSVCQDILMGAFIGWSLFEGRKWLEKLRGLKKHWVVLIYITGFAVCVAKNKIFVDELLLIERLTLSLFFAFVILDQIRGDHSFFKLGKIKFFNYLGKISYGLYMYHLLLMFFIFDWIKTIDAGGEVLMTSYILISFVSVVIVASLSYQFIEKPLLRLKPK